MLRISSSDNVTIKRVEDSPPYDGHCLRAFYYYRDQMVDIEDTVESINSIEQRYPNLRKESKAPTFALTYQGTYRTLMTNLGWSEFKAKSIESAYHKLYQVSDEWVQSRIEEAMNVGYGEVAFGLRLRTPLLKRTTNKKLMTNEAKAESRTFGNALGQSWGMLNNRAAIELKERMKQAGLLTKILPIAHIHDASYYVLKADSKLLEWLNKHLPECMLWQEAELIKHDTVKLGGNLEVYHPNWANKITLPNFASAAEIREICKG